MSSLGPRRSSYGLDSQVDNDWSFYGACRGKDPDWRAASPNSLSRVNQRAAGICQGCTVKRECHEDTEQGRPVAVIAGGCRWNYKGQHVPGPACPHRLRPARGAR